MYTSILVWIRFLVGLVEKAGVEWKIHEWMKWNEIHFEKKWNPLTFFEIVDFDIANKIEKKFRWKIDQKSSQFWDIEDLKVEIFSDIIFIFWLTIVWIAGWHAKFGCDCSHGIVELFA